MAQVVPSEILDLRVLDRRVETFLQILLNLQFSVAAGEPVTRDRMLAWIEEADADKSEKARARLTAGAAG